MLGGSFSSFGNLPRMSLARARPDGGADPAFDVLLGMGNSVTEIVLQPDGRILATGNITQATAAARKHVIRLSASGLAALIKAGPPRGARHLRS